MNDHLVPAGVRHLDQAPPTGGAAPTALVDSVLEALEAVPPVEERDIPGDLLAGWSFTAEWLAEAMPTLDAITREALGKRLRQRFGDPSPAIVEAIGRFWVRWLLEAMLWGLLTRLGASEAERLLEVAGRRVPRAEPVVAAEVLRTLAAVAGPLAMPLLGRFANLDSLHPDVREQSERELRLLRTRQQ